MKKIIIPILLVFGLALIFRLLFITSVPLSLNWDETTFAYNAFSLLETGRDEYGVKWPLIFESIGDYKCPMYIYLLVPVIKILGLTEWSVRFVPAFLGSLSVLGLYLVTRKLISGRRIALLAGLILAISPWHLQFTRAGADVGVSTFFVIFGLALFLYEYWSAAAVFWGLSLYSYFGERLFTPLLVTAVVIIYAKKITGQKKKAVTAFLAGLLTVLPLAGVLLSAGHREKVVMTTLLGYRPPEEYTQKLLSEDKYPQLFIIFHNPFIEYGKTILDHFLNHFSPTFLFTAGPDDDRQRIAGMGMLYRSDLILIAAAVPAILFLFRKKRNIRMILLWLAIGPIPAAITKDFDHARRSLNMVYPLAILLGIGGNYLWEKGIFSVRVFWGILFLWSAGFYLLSYMIFTPLQTYRGPGGWQYGYKQLVAYISPIKNNYRQVIVDTSYQGPYIYFLFYEKYPPQKYQPQARLVKKNPSSLGEGAGYDNYLFRDIYWPADRGLAGTLFAGPPERLPLKDIDNKKARLLTTIYFPDGTEAWRIVETIQ